MPHDPQSRPDECCPPPAGELHRVLHEILTAQHQITRHLNHLEKTMTDSLQNLQKADADLDASVQAAVAALNGGAVAQLQQQLADAQAAAAALQVQDDADKAALTDALGQAQTTADDIESQVSALNAATGTTPPAA